MSLYPPLPDPPRPPASTLADQPAVAEPGRRSKRPAVVGLLVLAGLVASVGGIAVWLSAPGRCDAATFTSERFGYCLVAPAGWSGGTARVGDTPVDQLLKAQESAAVFIQAIDISDGQALEEFVGYVRSLDEQAGFDMGEVSQLQVDGVQAARWDVTSTTPTGEATMVREVVFVKGAVGWRVQLADSAESFESHAGELQQMLDSWRFT